MVVKVSEQINRQNSATQNQKIWGNVMLNVKVFGAKGDGISDDTSVIQSALDSITTGGTVYFPDGTYMINGNVTGGNSTSGGIAPKSNTTIVLSPGATLKVIPTTFNRYTAIRITEVDNVRITGGGTIEGERGEHIGVGGEWGFGIRVAGATNITIESVLVRDFWGDGIVIVKGPTADVPSTNIKITDVISDNNRRQGLSVVTVSGLYVSKSTFSNTNGTAPQCGVDLEPDLVDEVVTDIVFSDCVFSGNAFCGLAVNINVVKNVTISNCIGHDNVEAGIAIFSPLCSDVSIVGGSYYENGNYGIRIGSCKNISISDVITTRNGSGLGVLTSASKVSVSNIQSNNNTTHGLSCAGSSEVNVSGGVYSNNGSDGINIFSSPKCNVSSAITANNGFNGIRVSDNSHQSNITTCQSFNNQRRGVSAESSDALTLSGNIVHTNSQVTNTAWDNITLIGTTRSTIQNNNVRAGSLTNKPNYGIRVAATAADTLINGNDAYDGGAGAGISSASGTTVFGAGNRNKDGTFTTTPN